MRLLSLCLPFLLACSLLTPAATATATPPATALLQPTLTATATFTPSPTPTISPTPDYRVTNPENHHLYLVANFAASWHEAHEYCSSLGGHLATIQSAQENQFVTHLAPGMWLGATDEAQEGAWLWVTGEPFDYSSWSPGEPNNCCPAQHCGPQECTPESYLTTDDSGQWNDTPEGEMLFVCEWDRSS